MVSFPVSDAMADNNSVSTPPCDRCSLGRQNTVSTNCLGSRATTRALTAPPLITFVVDNPSREDDGAGETMTEMGFVSQSLTTGQAVWRVLRQLQIKPASVNFVALTRCHSRSKDKLTDEQVKSCLPYLWEELRAHPPQLVVAMGATAAKFLTGHNKLATARGHYGSFRLPKGFDPVPEDLTGLSVTSTVAPGSVYFQEAQGMGTGRNDFLADLQSIWFKVCGLTRDPRADYAWLSTFEEIDEYLTSVEELYARGAIPGCIVDVETNQHLDPFKKTSQLVAIGFTHKAWHARAIMVHHKDQTLWDLPGLWEAFVNRLRLFFRRVRTGGWNYKFDIRWVRRHAGVDFFLKPFFDGLLAHNAIYSELAPHDLKNSAIQLTGSAIQEADKDAAMHQLRFTFPDNPERWHMGWIDAGILLNYLGGDVDKSFQCYEYLDPMIDNDHCYRPPEFQAKYPGMSHRQAYENLMLDALVPFSEIEDNGLKVNRAMLTWMQKEYPRRLEAELKLILDTQWAQNVFTAMNKRAEDDSSQAEAARVSKRVRTEAAKAAAKVDYEPKVFVTRPLNELKVDYKKPRTVVSYHMNMSRLLYDEAQIPAERLGFPRKTRTDKYGRVTVYYPTGSAFRLKIIEWALLNKRPDIAEFVRNIETHAKDEKRHSGYVKKMPSFIEGDGFLRTSYNLTGARTGRCSTADPNFHAMPTRDIQDALAIIKMFESRWYKEGGLILQLDYSQLEMRLVGAIAEETALIEIFLSGIDTHRAMAAKIFHKRPEDITSDERKAGKCVHPDTLVWGADGVSRAIGSVGTVPTTEDTFACIDDMVLLESGNGFVRATETYNGGVKPLVHVVSKRGVLTCTENHRFQLADGSLVRAGDLTPGLELATPELPTSFDVPYAPVAITYNEYTPTLWDHPTHDHAYFAGAYVGDGCVSGHGAAFSHGDVSKTDAHGNSYADWQNVLFSSATKVGLRPVKRAKVVWLGDRLVRRYLKGLELATEKGKTLRIPSWVRKAGRTAMMHFFAGLFDTDGNVSRRQGAIEFTTKDAVLAGQAAACLNQIIGLVAVEATWNKTYAKYYYRLRLSVTQSWEFRQYLRNAGKRDRLRMPSRKPNALSDNTVTVVVPAGEQLCVDLSVASDDHLYVANNFVTHNTIAFGILYGMAAKSLAARTGLALEEAERLIASFFEQFPNLKRWMDQQVTDMLSRIVVREGTGELVPNERFDNHRKETKKNSRKKLINYAFDVNGYITTVFGRKRNLKDGGNWEYKYAAKAERQAFNTPIQSAASDIALAATIRIHNRFKEEGLRSKVFGFIHDSIKVDVFPGEFVVAFYIMREEMEQRPKELYQWLTVPIETSAEVGTGWGYHVEIKKADFEGNVYNFEGDTTNFNLLDRALRCAYDVEILSTEEILEDTKVVGVKTSVGVHQRARRIAT